jgi:hypothetical protein
MILEFKNIAWFLGLIIFQIFVIDAIDLGTYPIFFLQLLSFFYILKQRLSTTVFQLLIIAFFLGMITDIFRNTLGLNTFVLLMITYLKPTFLYSITSTEDIEKDVELNIFNIGILRFLLFFGSSLFFYHLLFFLIEQFSFQNLFTLLLRSLINTISSLMVLLFSTICIYF